MIASMQITNTETFTFISVLAFKLLSRKVLYSGRVEQNTETGEVI